MLPETVWQEKGAGTGMFHVKQAAGKKAFA
jgi:hypothetical protein